MSQPSRVEQLVSFFHKLRYEDVPSPAIERAKSMILDTLGCCVGSWQLAPARMAAEFVQEQGGAPQATVVGYGFATSAVMAAFANGAMGHADEVDDSHFGSLTHPGCVNVPAALACAEYARQSGRALVLGVLAGAEGQTRGSAAVGPRAMLQRGFLPLGVVGCMGATIASAKTLGLAPDQMRDAVGLGAMQMAGLAACLGEPYHHSKAMLSGNAARNGVSAALLAQRGCHSPADIFEGEYNLLQAYSDSSDPANLLAGLGSQWQILGTSIKKHAAGQPMQAVLDALFAILEEHRIETEAIETVTARIARSQARVVNNRDDHSISLQHITSVGAIAREVSITHAHDPRWTNDPAVRAFRSRVHVEPDEDMDRLWPAARPAVVTVQTKDGRQFQKRVDHPSGYPENPLTYDQVGEKFMRLTADILSPGQAERAVETIRSIEQLDEVSALAKMLTAAR